MNRKLSQSFKDRADEACFWEAWVATLIARQGFRCTHMDFHVGEEADPEKATSFDLIISGLPTLLYLDVKSKNLTFDASPSNFPYKTINVCSENFANRNFGDPSKLGRHFLIVSQRTGYILWLPRETPLRTRMVIDGTRSEAFQCMAADRDKLKSFKEFIEYLDRLSPEGV